MFSIPAECVANALALNDVGINKTAPTWQRPKNKKSILLQFTDGEKFKIGRLRNCLQSWSNPTIPEKTILDRVRPT